VRALFKRKATGYATSQTSENAQGSGQTIQGDGQGQGVAPSSRQAPFTAGQKSQAPTDFEGHDPSRETDVYRVKQNLPFSH